jgi:hypothetical protein
MERPVVAAAAAAAVDTAVLDFQSRMGQVRHLRTPQNQIGLEQQELVRRLRNLQSQIEEPERHQSRMELERRPQKQTGLEQHHQSQSPLELEPHQRLVQQQERCHQRKTPLRALLEQLRCCLQEQSLWIH